MTYSYFLLLWESCFYIFKKHSLIICEVFPQDRLTYLHLPHCTAQGPYLVSSFLPEHLFLSPEVHPKGNLSTPSFLFLWFWGFFSVILSVLHLLCGFRHVFFHHPAQGIVNNGPMGQSQLGQCRDYRAYPHILYLLYLYTNGFFYTSSLYTCIYFQSF